MKTIYWGLLLLLSGSAATAQTCDSSSSPVCDCATRDLSPAGIMLGHEHPKGAWKISYRYMSVYSSGLLWGQEKVDDNFVFNNYIMSPQNMRMDMHMLMGMYGITDKLSVMAMLNYNVMTMNMDMLPGTMHMHMDGGTMVMTMTSSNSMQTRTSGLGDSKLYGMYSILNSNRHHLLVSLGLSLPTGSIRKKGASDDLMYPGMRYPYMMQLGSGTIDVMPGITYLFTKNKFSASAQVAGTVRPFYNSQGYRLGNEAVADVWAAYKFLPWLSASLRSEATKTGVIAGYDPQVYTTMEPSAAPGNYGGESYYGFAGLNFYMNRGFLRNNRLSVEYGVPLYQSVNGIQLAARSALYAEWMIAF